MQRLEGGWAAPGPRFMCGAAGGESLLGARVGVVLDAKGLSVSPTVLRALGRANKTPKLIEARRCHL